MKRRAKAAQEGEEKTFGGSAIFGSAPEKKANKPLRRKEHQKTVRPAPLTNQMMYSLEVYLYNIAVASMQTAAKGGQLVELAASLAISVHTVARQQQ